MTHREWVATGDYVKIENRRPLPVFDPRSGEHLWAIFTAYRWGGPHVETPMLDGETLLMATGPGCYFCERLYTAQLAQRRCPGPKKI
jgi:hypothetical protein